MRTIKFRGKDATTNDWRYGDMTHTKGITESGLYDRASEIFMTIQNF
jgi:hypothetical protein